MTINKIKKDAMITVHEHVILVLQSCKKDDRFIWNEPELKLCLETVDIINNAITPKQIFTALSKLSFTEYLRK